MGKLVTNKMKIDAYNAKESTFFRPKFKTEQDRKNVASMRALKKGGSIKKSKTKRKK